MSTYFGYPIGTAGTIATSTQYVGTGIDHSTYTLTAIGTGGGGGSCTGGYTYQAWPFTPMLPAKVDLTQVTSEELMDEVLRRGVFNSIKEYRAKKQAA